MAAFVKYQDFVEQLGKGVHHLHDAGDQLKICLSNTAIVVTHTLKSQVTEITPENGYPSTPDDDVINDYTETTGTGTMTGTDVVFTASGGSFGPFQFAIMYNETATSPLDALIGSWDYGSSITVLDTETFTVNFGASILTIGP